jgi:hypothetical protein
MRGASHRLSGPFQARPSERHAFIWASRCRCQLTSATNPRTTSSVIIQRARLTKPVSVQSDPATPEALR